MVSACSTRAVVSIGHIVDIAAYHEERLAGPHEFDARAEERKDQSRGSGTLAGQHHAVKQAKSGHYPLDLIGHSAAICFPEPHEWADLRKGREGQCPQMALGGEPRAANLDRAAGRELLGALGELPHTGEHLIVPRVAR